MAQRRVNIMVERAKKGDVPPPFARERRNQVSCTGENIVAHGSDVFLSKSPSATKKINKQMVCLENDHKLPTAEQKSIIISGAKNKSESVLRVDDAQSSDFSSRKPEDEDKLIQQPNVIPPDQVFQHEHRASISQANNALDTNESSKLTEASVQDKQKQDTGANKQNSPGDSPDTNMEPSSNLFSPGSPSLITPKYQSTVDEHLASISQANGAVETNESSKLTEASLQDKKDQVSGAKNKSKSVLQVDEAQSSDFSSRKPEEKDKLIQQPNVIPPKNQAVQHENLASISQASDALETNESSKLAEASLQDNQDQVSDANKRKLPAENSDTDMEPSDFCADSGEDEYKPEKRNKRRKRVLSSSSSSSSSGSTSSSSSSSSSLSLSSASSKSSQKSVKKGKKRRRNTNKWKKNVRKDLRNKGKQYVSSRGKVVKAREMKPPCGPKCRLSCSDKFTEEQRLHIFTTYWDLGSQQRQRDFLISCVNLIQPTVRRIRIGQEPRNCNCSFSLLKNANVVRVCKTFLLNTLAITPRVLRTVISAKWDSQGVGIAPKDNRGSHGKHKKTSPEILDSIREHINSIPRIESHYLRAQTTREYVDGGLTIAEMHRNYKEKRAAINKVAGNYDLYSRIFNTEFNISFFIPKKDQCKLCESYKNSPDQIKASMEEEYKKHHQEKKLSRAEKKRDLELCKKDENNVIVAIYDLEAILPTPQGDCSSFHFISKLNCYNLTVSDMKHNETSCFFWNQCHANKGAIEIGSCVYKFLEDVSVKYPNCDIIFYSDNCCGQQKNRFVFSMYYYAVSVLPIKSITHKFLIVGHTQNEGDSVHSTIEKAIKRAKKSGPIFVPDQYAQIIRYARKRGKPYTVKDMNFNDFHDLKALADDIGFNIGKDCDGNNIKTTELSMIRFTKDHESFEYKTSYEENWRAAPATKQGRTSRRPVNRRNISEIELKQAYDGITFIKGQMQSGLKALIKSNIIPGVYGQFYESLFESAE